MTYSTGAVAADANGFFHPLGDHAQVSYVIDGQPISDQQSKMFSTQIPLNALQSMELITGAPDAQYGDKTSLVVNATTRSGLERKSRSGASIAIGLVRNVGRRGDWGSGAKFGNFVAVNANRSGHFLDTPELVPIHDIGNNESIFDRVDWQPAAHDALHLNLFAARNWFQVPNDYDQLTQDQKLRVLTWNIAPGYQHTFDAHTLLTVNPCAPRRLQLLCQPQSVRRYADHSRAEPLPDELRVKADISYMHGRQTLKVGTANRADAPAREISVRRHRSHV